MDDIFYASHAALWALVVLQSLVLLGLVRTVYRIRQDHELNVPLEETPLMGETVPTFSVVDISGRVIDERALAGNRHALLFVSPDCASCSTSLEELHALMSKTNEKVIVVCRAGGEECRRLARRYGLEVTVVVDADRKLSELFGVRVTPTAVLIGANGVVETYGHPLRGDDLVELWSGNASGMRLVEAGGEH